MTSSQNSPSGDSYDRSSVRHGNTHVERVDVDLGADDSFYVQDMDRYRFAQKYVQSGRVLDIACGSGYGTYLLSRVDGVAEVLGIDIDEEVVERAQSRYASEGVRFETGSGYDLPYDDEAFDFIVSMETVEHVDNPARFVAELHRVLVTGGTLIMSTPLNETESRFDPANPYHVREYSAAEFTDLLDSHFETVDIYTQIVHFEDDLFGSDEEEEDASGSSRSVSFLSLARRAARFLLPSAARRAIRGILGSEGRRQSGSTIQPGISSDASVQIALCRKECFSPSDGAA